MSVRSLDLEVAGAESQGRGLSGDAHDIPGGRRGEEILEDASADIDADFLEFGFREAVYRVTRGVLAEEEAWERRRRRDYDDVGGGGQGKDS